MRHAQTQREYNNVCWSSRPGERDHAQLNFAHRTVSVDHVQSVAFRSSYCACSLAYNPFARSEALAGLARNSKLHTNK
jgi:hypothetical protein